MPFYPIFSILFSLKIEKTLSIQIFLIFVSDNYDLIELFFSFILFFEVAIKL